MKRHAASLLTVLGAALGTLLALACPAGAAAQGQYPDRVIKLVVPWAVGGSTDTLGRVVAERMSQELGQTIIVENKPGATGTIGFAQVARSPADGYTMLLGTNSTFAIAPHVYASLPYDFRRDFEPVGMIGINPQILCVPGGSAIRSLTDLVQKARTRPDGGATYASSGIGGSSHLATELLMAKMDFNMVHVSYKGGAPALQGVLAQEVDVGFVDVSIAEPLIRSGRLRALGTSGQSRAPMLPDVPTLEEAGARGFDSATTFGLLLPAKVAPTIVSRVNQALNVTLRDPKIVDRLTGMGFVLTPGDARALVSHEAEEHRKWGELIRQRRINLQQ